MTVTLVDGRVYVGTFFTATPFAGQPYRLILKAPKLQDVDESANSSSSSSSATATIASPSSSPSPVHTHTHLTFTQAEIARIHISSSVLDANNGNPRAELMTDAAVRKKDISHLHGRDLETASAWLVGGDNNSNEPAFDSSQPSGASSSGSWNQFEANKRLFNVRSSYDENLYTSKLDTSKLTRKQMEEAGMLGALLVFFCGILYI